MIVKPNKELFKNKLYQTDLNAIDDENNNPLFDELDEQKGAN